MALCPICKKTYYRSTTHSNGEQSFTHHGKKKSEFNIEYVTLSFCHTSTNQSTKEI